MSQLDLALHAGFSARHISFVETGRAQPSRDALLAIADVLDVPLRERNRLLEAAGYAPAFKQTPLAADEVAHIRGMIAFILERHEPYPAVVLDRYANCVMGNPASTRLIQWLVDPSLLVPPVNYLRITFHPQGARRWITNWDEVARNLFARAERELVPGGSTDSEAGTLIEELRGYGVPANDRHAGLPDPADLLLPVQIKTPHLDLCLFTTIMTLGTPADVTLQELRIETFFPADPQSERAWREAYVDAPAAPSGHTG